MGSRFTQCRRGGFLGSLFFGLLAFPLSAGGSLGVENTGIQVSYSLQHACQHDDGQYRINWQQFRNELAVAYPYSRLIQNGLLFEQGQILFIHREHFFAHYRGRFDPGYFIWQRYHRLLDSETGQNFVVLENTARDVFLNVKLGQGTQSPFLTMQGLSKYQLDNFSITKVAVATRVFRPRHIVATAEVFSTLAQKEVTQ